MNKYIETVIRNVTNPIRALDELKKFVQEHKSNPSIVQNPLFREMADFYLEVVDTFRDYEQYKELFKEHEDSIDYLQQKIQPYILILS